jgi:hypothetical protein
MLQLPASWLVPLLILHGCHPKVVADLVSQCAADVPQNCRNVLVRSNASAPGGATAKLADFGLSRAMKQHQTHRTTKTCGTLSHMVSIVCGQLGVAYAVLGPCLYFVESVPAEGGTVTTCFHPDSMWKLHMPASMAACLAEVITVM